MPGYPKAAAAVDAELTEQDRAGLDSFDTTVTLPLARCRTPGRRITLLLDGYDQPDPAVRTLLAGVIRRLVEHPDLAHLRVMVNARTGTLSDQDLTELGPAHRITLPPPTPTELTTTLQDTLGPAATQALARLMANTQDAGGSLITRLLTEPPPRSGPVLGTLEELVNTRIDHAIAAGQDPDTTWDILRLLVAPGTAPVLPLTLLTRALPHLGTPNDVSVGRVRDILVNLGALISRGHPGQPHEHTGLAHTTLLQTLTHHPHMGDMSQVCTSDTTAARAHWSGPSGQPSGLSSQAC